MKRALVLTAVLAAGSAAALAQQVISAKSGLIHYIEGRVLLGDQPIEAKVGSFPEVKENATLRTEAGRAEVLLTPGVFLRVGENSAFRMVTNRLIDTRLELLAGSAVIEAGELGKDSGVTVVVKDAAVKLMKKGLYRFDAAPAAVRVFNGEAAVDTGGKLTLVADGRMASLEGLVAVAKFNKEATDALDNWSRRRGEYVALANLSAANSIRKSGATWNSSGWAFNPYYGMYTFIPMRGTYVSPYGFRFWSPLAVERIYVPRPAFYPSHGGGGSYGADYSSPSHTSTGYSGTMSSASSMGSTASQAPSTAASSVSSAPVSHSGGSSGSSGGGARR